MKGIQDGWLSSKNAGENKYQRIVKDDVTSKIEKLIQAISCIKS
jgi:hypothetical protein